MCVYRQNQLLLKKDSLSVSSSFFSLHLKQAFPNHKNKAVLFGCIGLRCCARAFSSCDEWGLLFVAVRGLLIAVASLVVEHGL